MKILLLVEQQYLALMMYSTRFMEQKQFIKSEELQQSIQEYAGMVGQDSIWYGVQTISETSSGLTSISPLALMTIVPFLFKNQYNTSTCHISEN